VSVHDGVVIALPEIIEQFLDTIWMERGLSENTLSAYRADLKKFVTWLVRSSNNSVSDRLINAERDVIVNYLSELETKNISARSRARLLSSLRRFYAYLVREKRIEIDPVALIDATKLGRALPKILTEKDAESLIMAPDTTTLLGLRDRVLFEVIYATGLRVSELISIQLTQINLQQGVLRVTGKGNKESLVPLGEYAVTGLSKYI